MVGCGDEKVTEMFVENLTAAMFVVLRIRCEQYFERHDLSNEDILEFTSTLAKSCDNCSDYLGMMFELLIPFSMFKIADRSNCMDMFDSAIIKLLPFFFACGGKFYGPSLVEEIIRMHLRVPLAVLNHRRSFFSINGKY